MTTYSVKIENGVVVDRAVGRAEGYMLAPAEVQIGWTYDGTDFEAPVIPPEPEVLSMLVEDWVDLWPSAKRVELFRLAQTDDMIADGLLLLQAQRSIKLRGHPRTEGFMDYLVAQGLLTREQANNLLDGVAI